MAGDSTYWALYAEAAFTSVGFFWKAGWAFVLGYAVSALIQAFVPRGRLARYLGGANLRSVSLATLLGAASSSCSFAALAAARSLVMKGAHFVAAVAFMFASTNLVIELGILILIFLGWEFLAAEIVGGFVLIVVSSLLIRLTYPARWLQAARERVEEESADDDDFDWRERIRSREGWNRVGRSFVSDWGMVWEEILIGFTVAGLVAVLVPPRVWEALFLLGSADTLPPWLVVLENALVAPFVAAATFIGSMGSIPLATVLAGNGVLFAGIMGFIYSDLMVPPLVAVNAQYYGWRVALYIAGVMYASVAVTALALHAAFALLGLTPDSARSVDEIVRFSFDYSFFLNVALAFMAAALVWLARRDDTRAHGHTGGKTLQPKRVVALGCAALVLGGLVAKTVF